MARRKATEGDFGLANVFSKRPPKLAPQAQAMVDRKTGKIIERAFGRPKKIKKVMSR